MKKLTTVCAVVAMLLACGTARATTVDWKGVTWTVNNGTAVVNGDDSLTLTIASGTGSGTASLHVNRLPWGTGTFDTVMDPWVQWAFEGHEGDILIEQETYPGPTIQAGVIWGLELAVTRYTTPSNDRVDEYFVGAADTSPISHVLDLSKRTDGTVEAKFDSDPLAESTFLKTNVGSNWGFNDVYLRLRSGTAGDTITFNDFQYGSAADADTGAIPEPMTMLAVGMAVAGLGGYIRKRRMA